MVSKAAVEKQYRRGCLFWLARGGLGLVVFFLILLGAGAVYQVAGSAADARRFRPPGDLVDVGGYRLHIYCMGMGSPTVILDHLGDGNSAEWALIQPEIAKTTRVCAYDRAGFGWSDAGPKPRTAGKSAAELHTALENAGLSGPYVLVGHSYGADVMRVFGAQYPDETAGMVMVDPGIYAAPDLPPELAANQDEGFMRAAPLLARVGLLRLADQLGMSISTGDLPADQAAAYRALRQKTSFWDQLLSVSNAMPETSAELRAVNSLGETPLIVLSADQPTDDFRRAWTEFNRRAAALSKRGEFRVVSGADHASLVNQRAYAAQVIQAVQDLLAR